MGEEGHGSAEARIRFYLASQNYEAALDLLSQVYLKAVFQYCLQLLHGEVEQAEEITQRVFEAACRSIPAFRKDSSVKTWLFAIAHKTSLSEMNLQARRSTLQHTN
jgi:RNA polymerase sigma factor (sigma-70 family)